MTVKRNITLLRGDSATGKITLINLIEEYCNQGEASGVQLNCDKNCEVIGGRKWKELLDLTKDSIVFIDE